MFGLLYNFYKFCKKKSERKITLALLGLDNAGKTTLLNTIKGEVEAETSPTFGFNSSTLQEGKYKIEVFDLGGGKTFRSVWSKYLAEVHAIVYVVDAADAQRFEESKKALNDALECHYMREKAILIFANKQDMSTASTAAEVVKGLGLATCRNSHNVIPCTAKTPSGTPVDGRLRDGLRWLTSSIDREYGRLNARVQAEAEEVRQEEARKKKEREERLRRQREERARQQKEEEERARMVEKENALHNGQGPALLAPPADGQLQPQPLQPIQPPQPLQPIQPPDPLQDGGKTQALHQGVTLGLPHTIESPGKLPVPRRALGTPASDLGPSTQDPGSAMGTPPAAVCDGVPAAAAAARSAPPAAPRSNPAPRPSSAQIASEKAGGCGGGGAGGGGDGVPTASTSMPTASAASAAAGRPASAGRGSAGDGGGSGCPSPPRPASAGSRAAGPAAEGSEEANRPRSALESSGGLAAGGNSDAVLRGSFSSLAQNKVAPAPMGNGVAQDVAA
ncbi:ADP-ribosylation factor-like protein 13B [Pleodorina starrii]|uniref:ADP-ribosylation factor-like protein 13B n=1 Tax=Pleodorina starrii TaxID=330485 RepID=A0A9W6EXQ5_9CHLO|nr:ADP-ribosylation factor-like protein 13B [Pleodorina starrii]GLC48957.1 ADP-ribosylation factor-like protein 13B [Pleodorina starrii]GLC72683.1 ADP-ribosylation factor-like protein 13B [Pleodorina starrii]